MSHLKVFGLVAYRHVLDHLIKKLDNNREQMILVGYHSMGGYKSYEIVNKRLVIIRDVIFDKLRGSQHIIIDYQPVVTGHNSVVIVLVVFERAETAANEVQVEEKVRR